jgi:hypothetical protein
MRSKLAIPAFLLGLLSASCSVESSEGGRSGRPTQGADSGNVDEPTGPRGGEGSQLVIQGESVVRLGFGQSVELEVRLESAEGEGERNQTIAFDLVGRPEDSSLSSLVALTNSEGIARVTLLAATRPVMFEVRASSGRARSVSFNVSVSGSGFGSLIVQAPYDGVRAIASRFAFAVPGVECDDARYVAGDPKTVFAPEADSAALIALPAGFEYAVVVIGESASGTTLVRGCALAAVADQSEDTVLVSFVDRALVLEPRFGLELTLEAGSAAAALGAAIRGSVNGLVRASVSGVDAPRDAEGHFWLDALDLALRDDDDQATLIALADELAAARMTTDGDRPERELASLLALNDEGGGAAASAIAADVRDALDTMVLTASLELTGDDDPLLTFEALHIAALPVIEGGDAPSIVLDHETASITAKVEPGMDVLNISAIEFSPQLGALAARALERVLDADEAVLGYDLVAQAGCASLDEWVFEQTFVARPCEGDCMPCDDGCMALKRAIARACEHSMSLIADAAHEGLVAVDGERPSVTLMGSLALTDGDGDLRAEQMEAERIDGLWAPAPEASLGDTLRGTAISAPAEP